MSENSHLRIHARIVPGATDVAGGGETTKHGPEDSPGARNASTRRKPARRRRSKLTGSERLMRNSAVACALLLGILALGSLETPWARKASAGIERGQAIGSAEDSAYFEYRSSGESVDPAEVLGL